MFMRELLNDLEHLCIIVSFILCLSQSVFRNDTEKISMSLRKCLHLSIEKCSQVLRCTFFLILRDFSSVPSGEGILHCCSQLRTCLADR